MTKDACFDAATMDSDATTPLTIVTVCHNESDHIAETIESVQAQTFNRFEWIVVDGASTDGTLEALKRAADPRMQLISEPDEGIYDAMNKGIRQARGEYIIFLNGGDAFSDGDVLQGCMTPDPRADIVYGDIIQEDIDGQRHAKSLAETTVDADYLYTRSLPHQSTFIRASLLHDAGMYDCSFEILGDHDFFARAVLRHAATLEYRPVTVSVFRFTGITYSRKNSPQMRSEMRRIRHRYFPFRYRVRRDANEWFQRCSRWATGRAARTGLRHGEDMYNR